jgi:isopentenyldiphosphate isomerase
VIRGWRDENYPVVVDTSLAPAFEIERAAVPHFGFRAWGVHVNGLVRTAEGVKVWVGQRAADKPTFPGMLDHLAAGGQPVGISRMDNVVKECGEEAGVPPELARNARFVRELHYCCETKTGLKPDTIAVYDLYLPATFVPQNTDGEVASFSLWTLDEVADAVANSDRFKPNCNLVLIDLLLRHGKLGLDSAAEAAISTRLYVPPTATCPT